MLKDLNFFLTTYGVKALYHQLFSSFGYKRYAKDPRFKEGFNAIKYMKDLYADNRCFIIGNGPSLNKTDLSLLINEYTFGLNRIYLLFPKLGFTTTHYVVNNRLVLQQFISDIKLIPSPKFTSWENFDIAYDVPDMHFLYRHNGAHFYEDITKGFWGGGTVTFAAMQIAYYLGFKTVILIGVDHNFSSVGKPNEMIISNGNDINHFDKNYFGKGIRWQFPDFKTSEFAYRLARKIFERNGRVILDATIGGQLKVFNKINYLSLF